MQSDKQSGKTPQWFRDQQQIVQAVFQKLKTLDLEVFQADVKSKISQYWRLPYITRALQRFISSKFLNRHQKLWSVYRLMLSFDLFSIGQLLYLDSASLQQYIDRFYGMVHWTDDRDYTAVAHQLLPQNYQGTMVEAEMRELMSLHAQVKADSLSRLYLNPQRTLDTLRRAQQHLRKLHLHCFKRHLIDEIPSPFISNPETSFLKTYLESSPRFKQQGLYLSCLLGAQDDFDKIFRRYEVSQCNIMQKDQSIQRDQELRMLDNAVIAEFHKTLRQVNEAVKAHNKNTHFSKLVDVICQLTLKRKEDCVQILELLKLNVLKTMFYDSEIRVDQIKAFYYLSQIELITEKSLVSLWERFKVDIVKLLELSEKSNLRIQKENHMFVLRNLKMIAERQDYSKTFSIGIQWEQPIKHIMHSIDLIFDEADLMVVSWICQNWRQQTQISPQPKTLFIGKTKAGKSSMLRFLSGDEKVKVGHNLDAQTFFPTQINLQIKDKSGNTVKQQAWDLPGLEQNKGKIFKLSTGYFLRILSQNQRIKVWYMIGSYNHFFNNSQNYTRLIEFLGELLDWNPENIRCLTFVFSDINTKSKSQARKNFDKFFNTKMNLDESSAGQIYAKLREKNVGMHHEAFEKRLRLQIAQSAQFFFRNDVVGICKDVVEEGPDSDMEEDEYAEHYKKLKKKREKSREDLSLVMCRNKTTVFKVISKTPLTYQKVEGAEEESLIKIEVHPLTFIREQRLFFENFDIDSKINQYLNPNNPVLDEMFLKLYKSMREFRPISVPKIKMEFSQIKELLKEDYHKIQKGFKQLNRIKQLLDKSDQIHNAIREILLDSLKIFFIWKDQSDKQQREDCLVLENYLQTVAHIKNSRLRATIECEDVDDAIIELGGIKSFKYQVPPGRHESMRWLYRYTEDNEIQYNLLRLFEEIGQRQTFNQAHTLMIQHYLMLTSQINHQRVLSLLRKMDLLQIKDIKNDLQLARLNYYGEGVFDNLKFSHFLKLNAIVNDTWHQLSHPFEIKIFCRELVFDGNQFNVRCTQGLFIVAETVRVEASPCILCVKKLNAHDFASVFILCPNADPKQTKKLSIKPGNYCQNIQIKSDKGSATTPEGIEIRDRRIRRIVDKGKVLSRTDNGDGTYLEKICYEPPLTYKQDRFQVQSPSYIIHLVINANRKLMEFGSLHLAKKLSEKIYKTKQLSKNPFQSMIESSCSAIVDYIVGEFSRTVIRITQKHFTDQLCRKLIRMLMAEYEKEAGGSTNQSVLEKIFKKAQVSCYQVVKEDIFGKVFQRITHTLRQQYRERYSKLTAAKKLQDDQRLIKQYCSRIITQSMQQVCGQTENHQLKRLAKIFNMNFQSKALKHTLSSHFEFSRSLKSIISNLFGDDSIFRNLRFFESYDKYAEKKQKQLKKEFDLAMKVLVKKKTCESGSASNIQKSSLGLSRKDDGDSVSTCGPGIDTTIKKAFDDGKYWDVIRLFEDKNIQKEFGVENEVYLSVVASYIKLNRFDKALQTLTSSSHKYYDQCMFFKIKKLFNILQVKYESFFLRAVQQERQIELKDYEKETVAYLQQQLDEERMSHSTIRYEQRTDKNASQSINILSFDGPSYKNGIVNVIFAAELEKITHRPILHMFDMVSGKNQSTFIASAMTIHKRGEKTSLFESSFKPEFRAYEFLTAYSKTVENLDDLIHLKKRYKEFHLKDLTTQLSIVKQQGQKAPLCYTTFQTSKTPENIYGLIVKCVGTPTNTFKSSPLPTLLDNLKLWPNFKSYQHINILSFGTGIYSYQKESEVEFENSLVQNYHHFNKWQMYFDHNFNLEAKLESFFWDHARIYLEDKWIEDTTNMRKLIDQLEDRPYLPKLLGWKQHQ